MKNLINISEIKQIISKDIISEDFRVRQIIYSYAKNKEQDTVGLELLLSNGASPNFYWEFSDDAPLHSAVINQNFETLNLLVKYGADINLKIPQHKGKVAMHLATERKMYDMLSYLVQLGAYIDATDEEGTTPLHYAVMSKDLGLAQHLINLGANINAQDQKGETPLHYAVKLENKLITQDLVFRGAEVNIKDQKGKIPFHYACEKRNNSLVNYLIDQHANLYLGLDNIIDSLHYIINSKNYKLLTDVLDYAKAKFDFNVSQYINNPSLRATPLSRLAVEENDLAFINWLIKNGLDIKKTGNFEDPLIYALKSQSHKQKVKNDQIIKSLLEHATKYAKDIVENAFEYLYKHKPTFYVELLTYYTKELFYMTDTHENTKLQKILEIQQSFLDVVDTGFNLMQLLISKYGVSVEDIERIIKLECSQVAEIKEALNVIYLNKVDTQGAKHKLKEFNKKANALKIMKENSVSKFTHMLGRFLDKSQILESDEINMASQDSVSKDLSISIISLKNSTVTYVNYNLLGLILEFLTPQDHRQLIKLAKIKIFGQPILEKIAKIFNNPLIMKNMVTQEDLRSYYLKSEDISKLKIYKQNEEKLVNKNFSNNNKLITKLPFGPQDIQKLFNVPILDEQMRIILPLPLIYPIDYYNICDNDLILPLQGVDNIKSEE